MTTNTSGLKPLGRAVLLKMVEIDELKTVKVVIPENVKRNSATVEQRAIVMDVGNEAWADEAEPRAQIGDKVFVTKFAGFIAKGNDGEIYRLVNDRDIFCKIEETDNG